MDCRRSLGLALCLLSGAAGCQHQVTTLPQSSSMSMPNQAAAPDPSQIKKASDLPPKEPPPAVLVSWGDFKAGEAFAEGIPPARQREIREEARGEYLRALARDPKYLPAYQGLARLYEATQDHFHAVEAYRRALRIAPRSAPLWYELGRSHNSAKELALAAECLSRAVQFDPENRDYLNSLGIVLAATSRFEESLGCFVRSSGEAMGYFRLAQTLQHLNLPELSKQYLAQALQKDPNLATAVAMRSETPPAPTPPIQRADYQDPSAPLSPAAPAAPTAPEAPTAPVGADSPLPQVINLESAENRSAPRSILVPPPPAVNLNDAPPTHP